MSNSTLFMIFFSLAILFTGIYIGLAITEMYYVKKENLDLLYWKSQATFFENKTLEPQKTKVKIIQRTIIKYVRAEKQNFFEILADKYLKNSRVGFFEKGDQNGNRFSRRY